VDIRTLLFDLRTLRSVAFQIRHFILDPYFPQSWPPFCVIFAALHSTLVAIAMQPIHIKYLHSPTMTFMRSLITFSTFPRFFWTGGESSGGRQTRTGVAVCSQRRALLVAGIVLGSLLLTAIIIAYAGPQNGRFAPCPKTPSYLCYPCSKGHRHPHSVSVLFLSFYQSVLSFFEHIHLVRFSYPPTKEDRGWGSPFVVVTWLRLYWGRQDM